MSRPLSSAFATATVVSGEPGIGKSSIWAAGVTAARAAGAAVLATTAAEPESDMPYVGLTDLLADLVDEDWPALPEPQREAIDSALLRRRPPVAPAPRTVAAAVLSLLRRRADRGPVLLAIDDLQWADTETQLALAFAVRRLTDAPLHLLLTLRTSDPLRTSRLGTVEPPLLGAVPTALRLGLPPLRPGALQALLTDRLGRDVGRDEAEQIATVTGGNPFWALEFGAALDAAPPGLTGPPVPASAQALVTRRLASLSDDVVEAVCVVAALGRASTSDVLRTLGGADPAARVDGAAAAGLIVESNGRLSAAHPLFGTAAVQSLPPTRRARLHRRIADSALSPETRALHLAALHAVGTEDQVSPATERAAAFDAAAASARDRGATTIAARFADAAVEAGAGDRARDPKRRIAAAQLHLRNTDPACALAALAPLDMANLDTTTLEQALPLHVYAAYLLGGETATRSLLDQVENSGRAVDPRRHALLLTLRSDSWYGDPVNRVELAAMAVERTDRAGSAVAVRHRALGNLIDARLAIGDGMSDALLERREQLEGPGVPDSIAESADVQRGRGLGCTDRLDEAAAVLNRCVRRAVDSGDEHATFQCGVQLAYREICAGRLSEAELALEAASRAVEWNQPEPVELVSTRGLLLLVRGDLDAVDELIARDHRNPDPRGVRRDRILAHLRGLLARQRGDLDQAATLLGGFEADTAALGILDPGRRLHVEIDLAEVLVETGEPARALAIADQLHDLGHTHGRWSLVGAAGRLRAQEAAARGDLDRAREWAAAAVTAHERTPRRPELGRSLLTLGTVARRAGSTDAADVLARARAVLSDTGHTWWRARAEHEADLLPGAAPDVGVDVLTAAERRVVAWVTGGATNRETASALHLSVRTVEGHLASVYRKLGVRSRTELAARRA